ncbi:MAG: polymer-forming cytoskeletal protein [Bryobacterales bacterium]|nr:polymer-forming cytoskeletal protein [Bryobacterales bacterium]
MWKRRDDSIVGSTAEGAVADRPADPGSGPGAVRPSPSEGQVRPGSTRPAGPSENGSRLGETVKFTGEIHAEEDLVIEGWVEGKIQVPGHTLILARTCRAHAEINALHLVVLGQLNGKVSVGDKVVLKKTGRFEGELVTRRLEIEDGAVFIGQSAVHTSRSDPKPPRKPRPTSRPAKPSAAAPQAKRPAPAKAAAKPAL